MKDEQRRVTHGWAPPEEMRPIFAQGGVAPGLGCTAPSHALRLVSGKIGCGTAISFALTGPGLFDDTAPNAVIYLAAESHVDRSISGAGAFIETNVKGTFNLLEAGRVYWQACIPAVRQRFRFLHVSTDEVYGSLAAPKVANESSPYAPSSPYAASKAAAENLVAAWHKTCGLPTPVTHDANTYRPFQHPEKLIPRMIEAALAGDELPVYISGQQID